MSGTPRSSSLSRPMIALRSRCGFTFPKFGVLGSCQLSSNCHTQLARCVRELRVVQEWHT